MELIWVVLIFLTVSECSAKKVIVAVKKNIKELDEQSQNVNVKLTAAYGIQNEKNDTQDLIFNSPNRKTINLQNSFKLIDEKTIGNTLSRPSLEELQKIVGDVEQNHKQEIVQILNVPSVYEMHLQTAEDSPQSNKIILKSMPDQLVGHLMYVPPTNNVATRPYRTIMVHKNFPKMYKKKPHQEKSQPNHHNQNIIRPFIPDIIHGKQAYNFNDVPQEQYYQKNQASVLNVQETTTETVVDVQNFDPNWFDVNLQNTGEKIITNKAFNDEVPEGVMFNKLNIHRNVYHTINPINFDQTYPPSDFKVNKIDDEIIVGTPFNNEEPKFYENQLNSNDNLYSQNIDLFNMEKPQAIHEVPAPKLSPNSPSYRELPQGKIFMQTIYGKTPTYFQSEPQNESGYFDENIKQILYNLPTSEENIQIKVGGNMQFGSDNNYVQPEVSTASPESESQMEENVLRNRVNMYYAYDDQHAEKSREVQQFHAQNQMENLDNLNSFNYYTNGNKLYNNYRNYYKPMAYVNDNSRPYKNDYKIRNRAFHRPQNRRNGPTNYVVFIKEKSVEEYR